MSAPADLVGVALQRIEAADWRACAASVPATARPLEEDHSFTVWGTWRPLSALERRAWPLPPHAVLGVMTLIEAYADGETVSGRALVRLPLGMRTPLFAAQVAWVALHLRSHEYALLSPAVVARLRGADASLESNGGAA